MFAYLIDGFVFAFFYEAFREYLAWFIEITDSWGCFLVFSPFMIRDFWFRNASIGKKVLGLVVVDENWLTPRISQVIKRSILTSIFGVVLLAKLLLRNKEKKFAFLAEAEWEYTHLKVRVVEKEVYNRLKSQASINGIVNVDIMNQLYEEYLDKM